MGAMSQTLSARTKKELRSLTATFRKQAERKGYTVQLGYEPARVKETKDGFEIYVRAHT